METLHTPEARALAELQKKDLALDSLAAKAAGVPVRLAALNAAFEEKRRSMGAARDALTALQVKKRDMELALAEAEEGIRKHQRELNMVKDNDAFKALLKEIEHDKAKKDELETAELMVLEEIDKASALDKAAQAEVKALESVRDSEAAALAAEGTEISAALETARGERAAMVKAVNAELLEKYEAIRASRGGLAVTPVHEDAKTGRLSCGGCHMGLTPQKALDVKKPDTMAVCQECRRLMYMERTIFG